MAKREELEVGQQVKWTSRYSGNVTYPNYRGEFNGQAILWTGTLQVAVPFSDIESAKGGA